MKGGTKNGYFGRYPLAFNQLGDLAGGEAAHGDYVFRKRELESRSKSIHTKEMRLGSSTGKQLFSTFVHKPDGNASHCGVGTQLGRKSNTHDDKNQPRNIMTGNTAMGNTRGNKNSLYGNGYKKGNIEIHPDPFERTEHVQHLIMSDGIRNAYDERIVAEAKIAEIHNGEYFKEAFAHPRENRNFLSHSHRHGVVVADNEIDGKRKDEKDEKDDEKEEEEEEEAQKNNIAWIPTHTSTQPNRYEHETFAPLPTHKANDFKKQEKEMVQTSLAIKQSFRRGVQPPKMPHHQTNNQKNNQLNESPKVSRTLPSPSPSPFPSSNSNMKMTKQVPTAKPQIKI